MVASSSSSASATASALSCFCFVFFLIYTFHFGWSSDELQFSGLSCDHSKKLKIFRSDPFDYQSIIHALKGCSGLFYTFEPPQDQPTYDVSSFSFFNLLFSRFAYELFCIYLRFTSDWEMTVSKHVIHHWRFNAWALNGDLCATLRLRQVIYSAVAWLMSVIFQLVFLLRCQCNSNLLFTSLSL